MSTIKTFERHITGDELIAACEKEAFPCQFRKWRDEGSDHIRFGFNHGRVFVSALYSTVSGRAFGQYGTALKQDKNFSTDDELDGTPWFDALLKFLYVE
jgi:hypothetical protein